MEKFSFGLTLAVVGMGGTLLSLFCLGLIIQGISRFLKRAQGPSKEGPDDVR